jgi:hypothetical protein
MTTFDDFFNKVSLKVANQLIYFDDTKYILFEKYEIKKKSKYYIVYRRTDEKSFNFNKLKNATTWVILDRYNKLNEARRVIELDLKLESVKMDKIIHAKLSKKKDLEQALVHMDKLQQDLDRQTKFQRELDKYIIMARSFQQRGFENELTRTSGK